MSVENRSELATKSKSVIERKSDRELIVTRVFDAPARIVFDCWTKPELMERWWAPRSFGVTMTSCEVDLRVGGKYKLVFAADGKEQTFHGVYKEVERPTKLVSTDDEQGGEGGVTTTTFTEANGKTTVVIHQLFASKEELDEELVGLSEGTRTQHEQLDELLPTLL